MAADSALLVWQDIADEAEAMVNDWYNREHHPERLGVPGFLSARRFAAIAAAPRYFIYYETECRVFGSPAYLARLNDPTEGTRRAMPFFRNYLRTVCTLAWGEGEALGGVAATWRLAPAPGRAAELGAWLRDRTLPVAARLPGVTQARLWQADAARTTMPTREKTLRGSADALVDWAIMVQANGTAELERASAALAEGGGLADHGAAPDIAYGTYRLVFAQEARRG